MSESHPGTAASEQSPRSVRTATTVFPLVIVAGAVAALLWPGAFAPLGAGITPALMIIMFGMGLTLTLPDFALVARRPAPILLGVALQYSVMPLLAVGLAWALQLPPALAAGLILVGCVPGGTSSNVITYLARGDVALSVTMTSVSTLLSPVLTPLLTYWLAGQYLPVDVGVMAWSIAQIVLLPVVAGLLLRLLLPRLVQKIQPALPWISVTGITYVVLAVVSASHAQLVAAGAVLILAVVLHNLGGYGFGYLVARLTGAADPVRRAVAIEVGMQNTGLAAGLGLRYFSPEAALPGAIFSVWHNISGGILASLWGRRKLVSPSAAATKPTPDDGA